MLNMDFSKQIVINTAEMSWISSPSSGVSRKPLEREFAESGHTSSIVRFDKDSHFPAHTHHLGEEILVLEGVFSDEYGDYGKGSYLRNPPNSSHSPFSKEGCTLFVKLEQFDKRDSKVVRLNTETTPWRQGVGGLKVMSLHEFEHEHVALVHWPEEEKFQPHRHFGGEEIFVLSGTFKDEHGEYPAGSWLRSPHLSVHDPYVDEETLIWVKTGHLLKDEGQ
ncbi:MAG: cupin domain-containing protein [Thiotrichaceae bacterium]